MQLEIVDRVDGRELLEESSLPAEDRSEFFVCRSEILESRREIRILWSKETWAGSCRRRVDQSRRATVQPGRRANIELLGRNEKIVRRSTRRRKRNWTFPRLRFPFAGWRWSSENVVDAQRRSPGRNSSSQNDFVHLQGEVRLGRTEKFVRRRREVQPRSTRSPDEHARYFLPENSSFNRRTNSFLQDESTRQSVRLDWRHPERLLPSDRANLQRFRHSDSVDSRKPSVDVGQREKASSASLDRMKTRLVLPCGKDPIRAVASDRRSVPPTLKRKARNNVGRFPLFVHFTSTLFSSWVFIRRISSVCCSIVEFCRSISSIDQLNNSSSV